MADKKFTDLPAYGADFADVDVVAATDIDNTTEDPTGTSVKVTWLQLRTWLTGVFNALYAPQTRNLTAGAGQTGGGDLSADRTFDVGAGDGITVNADNVAVDATVQRQISGGANGNVVTRDASGNVQDGGAPPLTEGGISHTNITDIGTTTHAQLDAQIPTVNQKAALDSAPTAPTGANPFVTVADVPAGGGNVSITGNTTGNALMIGAAGANTNIANSSIVVGNVMTAAATLQSDRLLQGDDAKGVSSSAIPITQVARIATAPSANNLLESGGTVFARDSNIATADVVTSAAVIANGNITVGNGAKGLADGSIAASTLVLDSRNIATGDGLAGGGNLGQDRTLTVDATVARRSVANTFSGDVSNFTAGLQKSGEVVIAAGDVVAASKGVGTTTTVVTNGATYTPNPAAGNHVKWTAAGANTEIQAPSNEGIVTIHMPADTSMSFAAAAAYEIVGAQRATETMCLDLERFDDGAAGFINRATWR